MSQPPAPTPAPQPSALPQVMVTSQAGLSTLIAHIDRADRVGFDTEFHSERTYIPRLMLLQFATSEGVWLVDPLADVDLRPLVEALQRPGLLVIGHALKNDLRILWLQFGILPALVFDTQIAASFLGHGLQIGLSGLLQSVLGVHQPKGDQMADWSKRPLPDRLAGYAAGDVSNLLAMHDDLCAQLDKLGRLAWVAEECALLTEPGPYIRDPEAAFQRVAGGRRMDAKEAGVVKALAVEREVIAQEEDLVPHFLLPDETLHVLAKVAPRKRGELEGDRRLSHRAVYRYAERWLAAIARGLEEPHHRAPGRPPPSWETEAVAALLMLQVNDIAVRQDLAPQLLVKRDAVLNAVREPLASAEELAGALELHGWRAELLVDPLWRLLEGRIAVRCQAAAKSGFRLRFEG